MSWSDWKPFGNSQIVEIPVFSELTKTVELDIEPTHVVIYTTTGTGYASVYTNGNIQVDNDTVCKITSVDGNKVTFSRNFNNTNWAYTLIAVAN